MQSDDSASQIELITGDLLMMLVELGVDSSVIGCMATRFPPKLAARLLSYRRDQMDIDLSEAHELLRRIRLQKDDAG
jgi:hypothetical protein